MAPFLIGNKQFSLYFMDMKNFEIMYLHYIPI